MKFNLLNGVKSQIFAGNLSVYQIKNGEFVKMVITAESPKLIVVLARLEKPGFPSVLAWPKSNLIFALNLGRKVDQTLANQMVTVLTSGKCLKYTDCYNPIEQYKRFIKEKFRVFGISHNSKFDFLNLEKLIVKNNWHFIVGGDFWKNKINYRIKSLLKYYRIFLIDDQTTNYSFAEENICQDL